MSVQNWWTDARVSKAIEICRSYPRWCKNCETEIGDVLGRDISYSSLRDALRHRGLGPPGSFCSGASYDCDLAGLDGDGEQNVGLKTEAPTLERILILPDAHIPYHSEFAWQLTLKAGRVLRPHRVIMLGDMVDNYCLSAHGNKDPQRINRLKYEIDETNRKFDELTELGAENYHLIGSNHDTRLDRYIADKCPELFGLLSVKDLLRIDERGWTYTPYRQALKVGSVHWTHDVGSAGQRAAAKARDLYAGNCCIGHVHRAEVSYSGNWKGEVHVGASFGWLGDPTKVDYLHQQAVAKSWTWGFGVAYHHVESGDVHIQAVPLVNGTCVIAGQLVVADSEAA